MPGLLTTADLREAVTAAGLEPTEPRLGMALAAAVLAAMELEDAPPIRDETDVRLVTSTVCGAPNLRALVGADLRVRPDETSAIRAATVRASVLRRQAETRAGNRWGRALAHPDNR